MINAGGEEVWAVVFNGDFDTISTHVYTRDTLNKIKAPCLLLEDDGTVLTASAKIFAQAIVELCS